MARLQLAPLLTPVFGPGRSHDIVAIATIIEAKKLKRSSLCICILVMLCNKISLLWLRMYINSTCKIICMCLCSTNDDFLSSPIMYNTFLLVIHFVQRNAFEYTNAIIGQKAWIYMDRLLWYPTYFLRPIDIWFSMVSDSDSYCSFSSKISSNLIKPSGLFLNFACSSTAMRNPVKYLRNLKTVNCDLVSRFHEISTKGLLRFYCVDFIPISLIRICGVI